MGIKGSKGKKDNKEEKESNAEDYENEENDVKDDDKDDEKDDEKKRNEVRKEFTLKFKKLIAKYIPPKILFKGNLCKRSLISKKTFKAKYGASNVILFNKYIVLTEESILYFYTKIFKPIFKKKFFEDGEKDEILSLNPIDSQTIVIGATDKVRIVNFYEKQPRVITCEIIQEIQDTEFYALNEKLFNGFLLLCGFDRKYCFYKLENEKKKFDANNKYKLVSKVEKVHNVYDDDVPGVVDLNNGRIFSWLIDDKNIKVIEYSPNQKIIKSMNGYGLHNAGLICDKYLLLMGLIYPTYYSWLMDTETLKIVKKWTTSQNDSFCCSIGLNKFIYGSTYRIACDEFIIKNKEFIRKNIYETYFKEDKSEAWEESFGVRIIINENTFITGDFNGRLMVFYCSE